MNECTDPIEKSIITNIAHSMFDYLGKKFPISCANDEFIYFPQVSLDQIDPNKWDEFSPDAVTETVKRLSSWERELIKIDLGKLELSSQIDIALLEKTIVTLKEQLSEIRSWESQPTFYLSIICIGLSRALETDNGEVKHNLAKTLPTFIDQGRVNIKKISIMVKDLSLAMVSDTKKYLKSLSELLPELQQAISSLDKYTFHIKKIPTREDFLLESDLLKRILRSHLNFGMEIDEINDIIDIEINNQRRVLIDEARKLYPGGYHSRQKKTYWQEVLEEIPTPIINRNDVLKLYEGEIAQLAAHLIDKGLAPPDLVESSPVRVMQTPEYMSAIRTGVSYSILPNHPAIGGCFYIPIYYPNEKNWRSSIREYRMTCAHETYPGHHLLDSSRWNLSSPLRRVIEQPLFYEGWACFAEELLRLTNYFNRPYYRLLLARRRLSHAIRGKVDIALQTGSIDINEASTYLQEIGISKRQARLLIYKYALNPGYQLCYTIGLHKFKDLYECYGSIGLPQFIKKILGQGEILFNDLKRIFKGE